MNNRGQSLIMFVLLLPVITLLIAFVIDSSLSLMEKNKLDGIITSNMNEALIKEIKDEDIILDAIKKNDITNASVSINDDELKVVVKSEKQSIFGELLNFDYYKLEFNYCANYQDKKINKKCGWIYERNKRKSNSYYIR